MIVHLSPHLNNVLSFDVLTKNMNPIKCKICNKTIRQPNRHNLKMHNEQSLRHKKYEELSQKE